MGLPVALRREFVKGTESVGPRGLAPSQHQQAFFYQREGLTIERSYCLSLVVQHVENRVQLGNLKHIGNLLGQTQEL